MTENVEDQSYEKKNKTSILFNQMINKINLDSKHGIHRKISSVTQGSQKSIS